MVQDHLQHPGEEENLAAAPAKWMRFFKSPGCANRALEEQLGAHCASPAAAALQAALTPLCARHRPRAGPGERAPLEGDGNGSRVWDSHVFSNK